MLSKVYIEDMPVHLNWQGPVTDKLNILVTSGSGENKASELLIQPFLQFDMSKNGEEAPTDGNMDEQLDNRVSLIITKFVTKWKICKPA